VKKSENKVGNKLDLRKIAPPALAFYFLTAITGSNG
jgi:hypothetical protein